jgi:hypothetical protein
LPAVTKKDVFLLILPAIGLAIVAIAMIVGADMADSRFFAPRPQQAKESFERFAKRVQSGAEQVSTERWIAMLRSSRETDEATCDLGRRTTSVQRFCAWCFVAVALIQSMLVLSVTRRLKCKKTGEKTLA